MTNYNKMKITDLELLLSRRGLPTGGSKIYMVAQLIKQDKEQEEEAKRSAERVRKASQVANASVSLASQSTQLARHGSDSRMQKRKGWRDVKATHAKGDMERRDSVADGVAVVDNPDEYNFMQSLGGIPSGASPPNRNTNNAGLGFDLIVNATASGAKDNNSGPKKLSRVKNKARKPVVKTTWTAFLFAALGFCVIAAVLVLLARCTFDDMREEGVAYCLVYWPGDLVGSVVEALGMGLKRK